MGSIPTEVEKIFSLPRVVPCFPLLGLTPSGLFMGLSSSLNYTSESILRPTIFGKTRSSSVVLWDFNFALFFESIHWKLVSDRFLWALWADSVACFSEDVC